MTDDTVETVAKDIRRRLSVLSPFIGQWQCQTCNRTFGRCFKRCAYCQTGDAIEDDWLRLMRQQTAVKAPWATEGRVTQWVGAQPPASEVLGNKEERKWRSSKTTRRSRP